MLTDKGHEKVQMIGNARIPYNEIAIAQSAVAELA